MQNFSAIRKAVALLWRCKVQNFTKLLATIRAPLAYLGLFSCIPIRNIACTLYTIVLCHNGQEFNYA